MRIPARLDVHSLKLLIVSLAAVVGATFAAAALAQSASVKLEWITWSFFRFTTPGGKVILTNPFITGNPDAAAGIKLEELGKADLILFTDAHRDELGDTVEIAKRTGARVVTPAFEAGTLLIAWGVPEAQVMRRNPGGRFVWEGITIRVVGAVHGSGGRDPTGDYKPVYGGVAGGFVITFENGYTVYFSGSSAATQDMALWAEAYKPDAMIFLMAPNSEPLDSAMAVKLVAGKSPNLKMLLPHHHRVTPPPGALTAAEMRKALDAMGISIPITMLAPKQSIDLSKR
jgi:L-ascorbate metabolism protein UlaG (beta-lactamase superfamily)